MKAETWVMGACATFFLVVAPAYWLLTEEVIGTVALTMTFLLATLTAGYLGVHAHHMEPRPEDRKDAEIADGAGELGFFPPYSWWPLWCALALGTIVFATAVGAWWMVVIGFGLGAVALSGWIFEYYRGDHAH